MKSGLLRRRHWQATLTELTLLQLVRCWCSVQGAAVLDCSNFNRQLTLQMQTDPSEGHKNAK